MSNRHSFTLLYINDVFRGMNQKQIRERGHNNTRGYGAGKELLKGEVTRLMLKVQRRP
jgi:superfamily II DNA helicase RecQ